MQTLQIRNFQDQDYSIVKKIYQEGMDTGLATFEVIAPAFEIWDKKFWKHCRLVAIESNQLIAWAALSPVSKRKVYEGVKETCIYVDLDHTGKGIGKRLLSELILESEKFGIWTLQAVIFPENIASIKIHEQLGFIRVGERKRIGQRDGVWRDTVLLERRSEKVGI